MKIKYTILLILIFSFTVNAQKTMSDYSFIQVPENFEFLRSADEYQLNSLTRFLFKKHGFNAYFGEELPDVRRCDGLYAEVLGKPGFVYTKITVIVKDCEGKELFRSIEGRSKYKEYKKAYQDATRKAFASFEGLGIQQKDIDLALDVSSTKEEKVEKMIENSSDVSAVTITNKMERNHVLPTARFINYLQGDDSFLFRKTSEGYSLYREGRGFDDDLTFIGKIVKKKEGLFFIDAEEKQHEAYFDAQQTLVLVLPSGNQEFVWVKN